MGNNEQKIETMGDLLADFIFRGNEVKEKIGSQEEIFIFSKPISKQEYEKLCSYQDQGFNIEKNGKYVAVSRADSNVKIFVLYFEKFFDSVKHFFLNMNPYKAVWNIFLVFVLIYVWAKIIVIWSLIGLFH